MVLIFDKYRESFQIVGYKQFDSLEPIKATFLNNGNPIDLSQYHIRFECKKSDGNIVIDDENINIKNICEIEMLLNEQVTVVNGKVQCEFVLVSKVDERQTSTFTFELDIQQSVVGINGYSSSLITVAERLHKDVIEARKLHGDLTQDIAIANQSKTELVDKTNIANTTINTLTQKTTEGNNTISELVEKDTMAKATNVTLNETIVNAKATDQTLNQTNMVADTTNARLQMTIDSASDDIAKINATGNKSLVIGASSFVNNEYTWNHSMNNDNLIVSFIDSETNEPLMQDYKIIDKNNILIRNSAEHPNIKVILSASFYQGNALFGTDVEEFAGDSITPNAKKVRLKDGNGIVENPVTDSDAVFMPDGTTKLTKKMSDINSSLEQNIQGRFRTKKYVAVGDSITVGFVTKPYASIVGEKLNMNIVNMGISGSAIAKNGISPDSIVDRINTVPTDADLISIFAGTNDFGGNSFSGNYGSTEKNTMYGAMKTILEYLLQNYPKAQIFWITPLPRETMMNENGVGLILEDYRNIITDMCNEYGVPVLDLTHDGSINPRIASHIALYATDGLHPLQNGHNILAEKITNFIKTL